MPSSSRREAGALLEVLPAYSRGWAHVGCSRRSAIQLAVGVAGAVTSVRRGHSYDLLWFHGNPARVAAEALTLGTALSAPSPMLLSQATCTVVLAACPDRRAAAGLHILGTMMVGGYLIERLGQRRLRPGGWELLETSLVAAGSGLAAAMAVLGRRVRRS